MERDARSDAHVARNRHVPVLTAATLGATALLTATRLLGDGPLDALRRDPDALEHGQVWRLLSPVLVQSDAQLLNVLLVFVGCAVIGAFAERILAPGRWVLLYVCGALVGHLLGEVFQPLEGGTSVAFVGILGGLGALAALGREPRLARFSLQALAAIPLAIVDTALGDIHGGPYLVGFAIGLVWAFRDEPSRSLGIWRLASSTEADLR
jgi:membrane associated rhomboid family serine protease